MLVGKAYRHLPCYSIKAPTSDPASALAAAPACSTMGQVVAIVTLASPEYDESSGFLAYNATLLGDFQRFRSASRGKGREAEGGVA